MRVISMYAASFITQPQLMKHAKMKLSLVKSKAFFILQHLTVYYLAADYIF